jgi:hypothetical protein
MSILLINTAMFKGMLFYALRGVNGWSSCSRTSIDVAKVLKISCNERLFRIFDRDYKYTLSIKYDEIKSETGLSPVFGGNGGFVVDKDVTLEQTITKRYKTIKEANIDINEIKKRQNILKDQQNMIRKKMLENVESMRKL